MGNYMDKGTHIFDNDNDENVRPDRTEVADSALSSSTTNIEIGQEAGESLNFHIFSYKQYYMSIKKRDIFKWASAKLVLTEELIRTNKLRTVKFKQCSYLEPATDYLSDDEMEEASIEKQLCALENYRTDLVELIGRLSLDNKSKQQKRRKGKRLKCRTLLLKKQNSENNKSSKEAETEMSDSLKLVSKLNCDRKIKRSPLKVKNN